MKPSVASDTGSSPDPERAERAALHRLRSTLARMKAELELAEADGVAPPLDRLLEDLEEAFGELALAEDAGTAVRVLVVDDDMRLADVTARALRRLGFDAHASAALRALRFGEVLVADLGVLAELDDAALEAVRAARPIIVTGGTDGASRALAERVDASDYMVKPVDLAKLATAVNRRKTGG